MKTLPATLLILLPLVRLQAAEPGEPASIKFIYQSAAGGERREAEAPWLMERGQVMVPLELPGGVTWLCQANPDPEDGTCGYSVGRLVTPATAESPASVPIYYSQLPLRHGEEQKLLVSTTGTLSVLMIPPVSAPEGTKAAPAPASRMLSEAELKRLDFYIEYRADHSDIRITGHNPFEKRIRGGVVRVTVSGREGAPELKREYAFNLEAPPLADFSGQVNARLFLPAGAPSPGLEIVRMEIAN